MSPMKEKYQTMLEHFIDFRLYQGKPKKDICKDFLNDMAELKPKWQEVIFL